MRKTKLREWGYRLFKPILGPLFKLYYNPKIYGKEFISKDGPIIIAGNHKHIFDQCSVILSTKRIVHYMAKKEYFDGKLAWFFKATGCISVDRDIHDENAKRLALEVLRGGGALGIFPEGTRNKTNQKLLPFKYGTVSMSKKTGAKIVPFAITGDYKFRSKNLTVRFGRPLIPYEDESLEDMNERLTLAISELMDKNIKA